MKGPLFYAKILLFEYGIIKDSKGLSIPYNYYRGASSLVRHLHQYKKNQTKIYSATLSTLKQCHLLSYLDLNRFEKDLKDGLYFDSSIPQGYGVGSSGALVASVYERYAQEKITVLENLTKRGSS